MAYRYLADLILLIHFFFVMFAALGGLLVLWRRWLVYFHLPAMLWAAYVMFSGVICPLTPWENSLRRAGGEAGYTGGFIEHYIIVLLYPEGLTRVMQISLGIALAIINLAIYLFVLLQGSRQSRT